MLSLRQIASRVKAAIKAYNAVQDFIDKEDWVKGFNGELMSAHLCEVLTRRLDQIFFSNRKLPLPVFRSFAKRLRVKIPPLRYTPFW